MTLSIPTLVAVALFAAFCIVELVAARPAAADALARGRLATNFAMPLLTALLAAAVPVSAAAAAIWARQAGLGLFNHMAAPAIAILALSLLVRSFTNYWLHRALHASAILWRIHRVHHSDRHVDVTLALRHHPFEAIFVGTVYAATAVALGLSPWIAIVTDLVFLAAGLWEHLDVKAPRWFERWFGRLLTSPDWHRVHHSADQQETDSNFGSLLSVWDRLFGTDRPLSLGSVERIGLGDDEDARADKLLEQLRSPLRR